MLDRTTDKPFSIFSLGDSAMTLELGHLIDEQLNRRALLLAAWLKAHPFHGLLDIIVAYSSVTVFYDPVAMQTGGSWEQGACGWVRELLEEAWQGTARAAAGGYSANGREPVRIPVCYGGALGPDLEGLSKTLEIPQKDIVELHTSSIYLVYMIGFLPGFPYLGKVDPRLETGRKERPVPVAAGGVGIAGLQTGIYPVNSPGGWQIIGRTPVRLFEKDREPPVKLAIGDRVQFYPVSMEEFQSLCPG
jgi:inhibitor of KinA